MKIFITNSQGIIHAWPNNKKPEMYRDITNKIIWGRHDIAGIDITNLFPIEFIKNFPQNELREFIYKH